MNISRATPESVKATSTPERVPRLHEEPEILKFVQCDAVQYEGDWDPAKYDPDLAQSTLYESLDEAVETERLGFDAILSTEHHFDAWTIIPSPNIYLALVAARTTRLRIGQSVAVLPFHNPWRLAEEAGMLDIISNGRMEVGLGKGNFSVERETYGLTSVEVDGRFDEGLNLMVDAFKETQMTFDGKFTRLLRPASLYPKPFPEMRPWVATRRVEAAEDIGRAGYNLYGSLVGAQKGNHLEHYLRGAQEAGHSRSGANYLVSASIIVAPTDAEAARLQERARETAKDVMQRRGLGEQELMAWLPLFSGGICGSPEKVLNELGEGLQSCGARRLHLTMRMRFMPRDVFRQTRELFATEVMPHLRHLPLP